MYIVKSTRSVKNWNSNSRLKINTAVILSWYQRRRKTKSQKEKQAKSWIFILHYITVGHIPDAFEILIRLMITWKIYAMKTIFSKNHCAAPERKQVYSGGIEIPCNYELFEPKIHKKFVKICQRQNKKQWMFITLLFFDSFFHLTQLWPNGFICGGDIITLALGQLELIT